MSMNVTQHPVRMVETVRMNSMDIFAPVWVDSQALTVKSVCILNNFILNYRMYESWSYFIHYELMGYIVLCKKFENLPLI